MCDRHRHEAHPMKDAASLATLVLLLACGRTDLTRTDGAAAGSARGGTTGSGGIEATGGVIATGGTRSSSSACGGRTPLKHRPAGSIVSTGRRVFRLSPRFGLHCRHKRTLFPRAPPLHDLLRLRYLLQ